MGIREVEEKIFGELNFIKLASSNINRFIIVFGSMNYRGNFTLQIPPYKFYNIGHRSSEVQHCKEVLATDLKQKMI